VKHLTLAVVLVLVSAVGAAAHDPGAVPLSWNREISRLVFDKCASCHRPGGTAFSLMTYQDAQPRLTEIKESVLARQMPPWGAVKGFGDFRNDQGLTQEQIALVTDWVEGGATRGSNRNLLPPTPKFTMPPAFTIPADAIAVSGRTTLRESVVLDGVFPERIPKGASPQITAALPDGSVRPLVWLYQYSDRARHPFLFRKPLRLPAGTTIRGVPAGSKVFLIATRDPAL
jgi:hypothetical protein